MFMAIFEFVGPFFLQNDVFILLKEDFSEHAIRELVQKGLGSFQTFLILQVSD
jgi:hypothetical protein